MCASGRSLLCARQQTCLAERAFQKIVGQRQLALIAASATFDLKAGLWLRRERLFLSRSLLSCSQEENTIIPLSRFFRPPPSILRLSLRLREASNLFRPATGRFCRKPTAGFLYLQPARASHSHPRRSIDRPCALMVR